MSVFNKKKKELNEWNYVEEKRKEKQREEEYIISSDKKFRARSLIITSLLCIAIIACGVMYIDNYIKTTNAEAVDNSQAAEIDSSDESSDKAETKKNPIIGSRDIMNGISDVKTKAEEKKPTLIITVTDNNDGFVAKAFADENGLEVEWSYSDSTFEGKMISVYMTDGISDYVPVGENIPIDTKKASSNEKNAKSAVGVLIKITGNNDEVLLEKNITVENTTYEPEVTYSGDIDIGDLFR